MKIIDHRTLVCLHACKNPRSIRWRLRLPEYKYEIGYKASKINKIVDELSGNPLECILAIAKKRGRARKIYQETNAVGNLHNDRAMITFKKRKKLMKQTVALPRRFNLDNVVWPSTPSPPVFATSPEGIPSLPLIITTMRTVVKHYRI